MAELGRRLRNGVAGVAPAWNAEGRGAKLRACWTSSILAHRIATFRQPDRAPGESSGLRLAVDYASSQAKVDDVITCHVSAERVGFGSYRMLLAEIGLPPGAEVDRESLEHAAQNFPTGIRRYDVLPDRVVFYLWPQAGGTAFDFTFRPRLGEAAKSAPSVISVPG